MILNKNQSIEVFFCFLLWDLFVFLMLSDYSCKISLILICFVFFEKSHPKTSKSLSFFAKTVKPSKEALHP